LKALIYLILFLGLINVFAENKVKLNKQTDCFSGIFSTHETWKKHFTASGRLTSENFEAIFPSDKYSRYKSTIECKEIIYYVGKTLVSGYYLTSKDRKDIKSPTLIYNRGGNARMGSMVFGAMFHRLFPLVESGFTVIGSRYRGGTAWHSDTKNYDDNDEYGGNDVDDVVALFKLFPEFNSIDANRVGMLGWSRGGLQTMLAVQRVDDIKAVALIATPTDLSDLLVRRPKMEQVFRARIPNYDKNKEKELAKRSILNWIDKTPNIPIFIGHAIDDQRVPSENALRLAFSLEELDREYKLVIYESGGHGMGANSDDLYMQLANWFNKYL